MPERVKQIHPLRSWESHVQDPAIPVGVVARAGAIPAQLAADRDEESIVGDGPTVGRRYRTGAAEESEVGGGRDIETTWRRPRVLRQTGDDRDGSRGRTKNGRQRRA